MQIDTTNNIILNTNDNGPEVAKKTPAVPNQGTDATEATLRAKYVSIIEKALEQETVNSAAVEEAREALQSGELDSAENIRTAAENILKLGM